MKKKKIKDKNKYNNHTFTILNINNYKINKYI